MDNTTPTITTCRGDKHWHVDGKFHRVDGPAFEYANGDKLWYLHGHLHRIDGPAAVDADGCARWYLYDCYYEFDDWLLANTELTDEEKVMLKLEYG